MHRTSDRGTVARFAPGVCLFLACLLAAAPAPAKETLTIRVNDAVAVPGGQVAVVLRTYASRPIGQGQLCLEVSGGSEGGPVTDVEDTEVVSEANDTAPTSTSDTASTPQVFMVEFESPSGTVNTTDGPLAVFYLNVSDTVVPGQTFPLTVDLANTTLRDPAGAPIELVPRSGTLTIRAPGDPVQLETGAENATPGGIARLFVKTNELFGLSSGTATVTYDPEVEGGAPEVLMSPRFGNAKFDADTSVPGRVVVDFESPDGTLNRPPGSLIEIRVPTAADVAVGSQWPLSLSGELRDPQGRPIPVLPEGDVLLIEAPDPPDRADLRVALTADGNLRLSWSADCDRAVRFAVYRGDLAVGYDSIAIEPEHCAVSAPESVVPFGPGAADFFLVVPVSDGQEGSYGTDSTATPRHAAEVSCHPQSEAGEVCSP